MTIKLLSFALFVTVNLNSTVIASTKNMAAEKEAAAKSAIAKAESSRQHAASVNGEWRDTGKIIKKAKHSLKEGHFDKAIKLAHQAERQGNYGYDQAISQKNQKNLASPSYLNGGSVSSSIVVGEGYITPTIKTIDVMHNGKLVSITRTTDKKAKTPVVFTHTARACPPFCVQPITVAKNIGTIGELEVLEYLRRISHGDRSIMVVDSRTPEWVQRGTIPGSVSIPWNKISIETQGTFAEDSETEILNDIMSKELGVRINKEGQRDFRNAKTLIMFCNGNWCPQSSINIKTLLKLGYPAYKLKWYRGGMQAWVSVGLTTIAP